MATGGDAVVAALEALGVEHVFGIVSVHNLPIVDAIERGGTIRFVPVRHEQAAVHCADGYARASGRLGVALTGTGPGAANAMGALHEAYHASSRVLIAPELRASAGLGVSWISPVGPLKLSYGTPIRKQSKDRIQRLQFQIGTAF